jgi:hypothetical protein
MLWPRRQPWKPRGTQLANNYFDKLAESSGSYPTGLGELGKKNLINPSSFKARQKARILSEVQKRYLKKGNMSPIERYGQTSASAMAQADEDF